MKTVQFNTIEIGTRFKHGNKTYEKTAHAKGGCCNKAFNAFCIDTEEPRVFSKREAVQIDEK